MRLTASVANIQVIMWLAYFFLFMVGTCYNTFPPIQTMLSFVSTKNQYVVHLYHFDTCILGNTKILTNDFA